MPRLVLFSSTSDQRQRRGGTLIGVLCVVMSLPLLAAFWLIPPSSKDYPKRWLILMFGVTTFIIGFQFLKELFKTKISRELNALINSLAGTVVFSTFAFVLIAGATSFGEEIRGGIPFLPDSLNNAFGRALFGLFGLLFCLGAIFFLFSFFKNLKTYLRTSSS